MTFPLRLGAALARHLALNELQGRRRYALVLKLEPLFHCNLSCAGCDQVREAQEIGYRMLGTKECLASAEQAGAPIVSLTGGEPLLHPEIPEIVGGLLAQGRFVDLGTNGILLESALHRFAPSPRLSFVVHLDGLAHTHDRMVGRQGVFDQAIASIRAARRAGFTVRTSTVLARGADAGEARALFELLTGVGVDGLSVAPGASHAARGQLGLPSRGETAALFQQLNREAGRFRFHNTPIYRQFLAGERWLQCSPWSSPTRNPKGWKSPCHFVADGYKDSFDSLMNDTLWERFGVGRDPRCEGCMAHSGFEASAVREVGRSLGDLWRMARWVALRC